jgi:hypothetical protein
MDKWKDSNCSRHPKNSKKLTVNRHPHNSTKFIVKGLLIIFRLPLGAIRKAREH